MKITKGYNDLIFSKILSKTNFTKIVVLSEKGKKYFPIAKDDNLARKIVFKKFNKYIVLY